MPPTFIKKILAPFKRPTPRTHPSQEVARVEPTHDIPPPISHTQSYHLAPEQGSELNIFPNARRFTIQNQHISFGPSKSLFDYLSPHIAAGAAHNSDERCDAPKCEQETRIAVQDEILGWIIGGDDHGDAQPRKITWVTGPAGAGKTAILGSIADECQAQGLLAASFFFSSFSGSASRRSKRCLVATLAYHLQRHKSLQGYGDQLLSVMAKDQLALSQRLEDQAETLILGPLREIEGGYDRSAIPQVIIIDGVDEVEAEQYHDPSRQEATRRNEDDQVQILSILLQCAKDPAFPFRILIASRPERAIEDFFTNTADSHTLRIFLDSKYNPDEDIELFLRAKFSEIRRRFRVSSTWPSDDAIRWIIDTASGQFIFAATAIRYISDPSYIPQQQLEHILCRLSEGDNRGNPYGALDRLYVHIFNSNPNPKLAVAWIGADRRNTTTSYLQTTGYASLKLSRERQLTSWGTLLP
ncbi:hypothetical protein FA13DRAFT_173330 [Coprinellus micaceus]|uniref:NACHT domain-containing protein n=1 Tax=Coprinellus micaceus TaxID=71717 RepID=A0A4Y7SID2_COPMI|nr:hypothetical protein FA13DRAFT_173330 [Coprinellus micaceus]